MKRRELIETIQDMGLSSLEAQLYVSSLSHGPGTALSLSRETAIKRATVYGLIESLKEKGLMRVEFAGTKRRFVAEHPEQLKFVVDRKKAKFDTAIPELASLYNLGGQESFIKYYEGLDGLKAVYENLLREMRLDDDYCVIAHQHEWYERDAGYFGEFLKRRARVVRNTRLIFQDSEKARLHKAQEKQLRQQVKLIPSHVPLPADIIITPRSVIIHQWKNPITTLVIENKDVVQTQLGIFNYIWGTL